MARLRSGDRLEPGAFVMELEEAARDRVHAAGSRSWSPTLPAIDHGEIVEEPEIERIDVAATEGGSPRATGARPAAWSCGRPLPMIAARKLFAGEEGLFTFDDAPIAGEPYTDEERAADEVGLVDIRAGRCRTIPREEMDATLERMRRAQAG